MKSIVLSGLLAIGFANSVAHASSFDCSQRALACRVSNASVNLYHAANRVGYHPYLVNASASLNEVARDFCVCNYSRFTPGSGVLMDRYHYVRYVYDVISSRGDITQDETVAMNHLISVIGQP